MKMKVLDLFSGIGGFSLGLERAGMQTVAFCENDPFCQKVLQKNWPNIPIHNDIRELDGNEFRGKVDLICGGFPCQPFSVAGKRKGTEDNRDLWPQMFRIIQQAKPTWIIGENVANFTSMAFRRTKVDLESEGYIVQPFIIPACAVNAPHRRDRLWIVANSIGYNDIETFRGKHAEADQMEIGEQAQHNSSRESGRTVVMESGETNKDVQNKDATNSDNKRCEGSKCKTVQRKPSQSWEFTGSYKNWINGWPISSPKVCGVDDGISNRTHRLRSLGNAVVPQIPEIIGKVIMKSRVSSVVEQPPCKR